MINQNYIYSKKTKNGKIKKALFIILGIILILTALFSLFIFLPNILGILPWDIPPIDDSDLRLEKITISQDENAFYDLVKLNDSIYSLKDKRDIILDHLTGKAWDKEFVEEILSKNKQALKYFTDAANKPKFQDPTLADPEKIYFDQKLPITAFWREISYFSAIKALYLQKQGKNQEAIQEALNSIKVGQKIQESQPYLIEYLIAMIIKKNGLEALQKIISSSNLSSEELKDLVQKLNKFQENKKGLIAVWKGEYHFIKLRIDLISEKNPEELEYIVSMPEEDLEKAKNNFYFQSNKTKFLFADYMRINIRNSSKLYNEIENFEIMEPFPFSWTEKHFRKNLIGKILYHKNAFNMNVVFKKRCEEDLLVSATQILAALKAYKNDTKSLPASLNKLVPNYISTIAIDPFDGKPIRYSSTEKIIYSVGKNLIDSGGSSGEDWQKMPDPTFRIDF